MTTTKQRKYWVALYLGILCLSLASFQSWTAKPAFDRTGLAGWHAQGAVTWRSDEGAVIGSVKPGGATGGWLVKDQSHEDFSLRLSYRCSSGMGGVLLRGAEHGNGMEGTYVSLTGRDAGTVYRVSFDADGRQLQSQELGAPRDQDANKTAQFPLQADDWNKVELHARGDTLVESFNGYRGRTVSLGGSQSPGKSRYGLLALGVFGPNGAQIRIKDVSVEDLTARAALPAETTKSPFREQKLTDLFYSEGIAVGDLNHDGYPDIVAGPFYYLGPGYQKAREIYPSATFNPNTPPYTDSFLNYVYDFNGDGWPDVLKINFEGAYLYINPQSENRHWDVHRVVDGIAAETTQLADVDGDGRPELIMSQGKNDRTQIAFAKPDWSDPTKPWTIHPVSEVGNWGGHGMGVGDINGDGRLDIVQASGWWEQPPTGDNGLWKFHSAPFGGGAWTEMEGPWAGGADIFVYDVNGDGLPDVITSLAAHGWGLAWFEQKREGGNVSWKRHMIMGNPSAPDRQEWEETDKSVAFSELHALALADVNGDGLRDIITGKRWWSHGDNFSGPDAQAPPVLYWFQLVRKPGGQVEWIPHLINNNSGVGTQIVAADINGHGKVDILTTGRKGAFVFFNSE